jgi:threonyl-tRNA synthetase
VCLPRLSEGEEKPIKVTLPDGSIKEAIAFKTTPLDIAMSISPKLAKESIVAKVCVSNSNVSLFLFKQ